MIIEQIFRKISEAAFGRFPSCIGGIIDEIGVYFDISGAFSIDRIDEAIESILFGEEKVVVAT